MAEFGGIVLFNSVVQLYVEAVKSTPFLLFCVYLLPDIMDVDPSYEYNAPQYVDFSCLDESSAAEHEKYFGMLFVCHKSFV